MTTAERIKELREWPFRSDAMDEMAKMIAEREDELAAKNTELADLHATLSAHTNCATDGRNWRMMWQRLCEQRQDAIRNAFDDGMRKAISAVCQKCGAGFSPYYRTECLNRFGKLPRLCGTCAMKNLDAFLSGTDPYEMPHNEGEPAVPSSRSETIKGEVPTTAPDCATDAAPGNMAGSGVVDYQQLS